MLCIGFFSRAASLTAVLSRAPPRLSAQSHSGLIQPFQKIWMCSVPNEFSRSAIIWTYLYFNHSEMKITEAKCLIILTGNVDGLPLLTNAWDISNRRGMDYRCQGSGISFLYENIIGFQITEKYSCMKY